MHSIYQQIWKTQQWPQDWKRSVFITSPKKDNAKECSNYRTIALISHASKVMLNSPSQASVMYGCESWTVKKAERRRIDAFELWCWRRLLRVPWTARRSNHSILKEISPEYLLEGLMLKLKFQYFGHLMQRTDSFEKTLMLGKIEGGKRRGGQRVKWLDGITDSMDMSLSKLGSW